MVICCGHLVVVSSIPPGDFFFVFDAKLLFWGAQRRAARDFGGGEKATVGDPLVGRDWVPQRQKPRSWLGEPPVLRVCSLGTRERFFGRTGRLEPPDVT